MSRHITDQWATAIIVVCIFLLPASLYAQIPTARVLVDSSRDGGVWWSPQTSAFDPALDHYGKPLADYLKVRGMQVTELPRPFAITPSFLSQFDLVIRPTGLGLYTAAEIAAYSTYVGGGGYLILLADSQSPGSGDTIARSLGLDFRGRAMGESLVNQFAPHPITNGITNLTYGGSGLLTVPDSATVLGRYSSGTFLDLNFDLIQNPGEPTGAVAMGIMPLGAGKVYFQGETRVFEHVPQPLVNNLLSFFFPAIDNDKPTLTAISPNSVIQMARANVTLTGTNFFAPLTISTPCVGIVPGNVTVVSSTSVTATFDFYPAVPIGTCNITVTSRGGTSNAVPFTINAAPVTITGISPSSGRQGTSVNVSFTLNGITQFLFGLTINTCSGVVADNIAVTGTTLVTARLTIAPGVAPGACPITIATPLGGTSNAVTFTVLPPQPGLGGSLTTTGTIATYAGSTRIPGGPAIDQSVGSPAFTVPDGVGGFYFTAPNLNMVYGVTAGGILRAVAGTGTGGFSGDGGPAVSAQLDYPIGLTLDTAGNLFIADWDNGRIRKVNSAGVITTVAGTGTYAFSGDGGPATSAGMGPVGVAVDTAGNLFIADYDNYRVRKVNLNGIVTTVAGDGTVGFSGDGGPAISARMTHPTGIAVDGAGNLFIADYDNGRIRNVNSAGIITTIAGTGTYAFSGDGGPATSAGLGAVGVAIDTAGNLFIADTDNDRIRKIDSAGIITTVTGNGVSGFGGDGGIATSAQLNNPVSVAVDGGGSLFIADAGNNRIRKVTSGGIITTAAGNGSGSSGSGGFGGDGGPATSAQLNIPVAVAVDAGGNLFIADGSNNRIRKVSPTGVITTVAGEGTAGFGGDGGPATAARLNVPQGVAVDAEGNLFIADTRNNRIRKVSPNGVITTVAGDGTAGFGGDGGPAVSAQVSSPVGLALDRTGNLFISDSVNNRIRKLTPAGSIARIAGTGTAGFSGDGGPATSATINGPWGIAVDSAGNLFIADTNNLSIRKVTPAGIITTVVGATQLQPATPYAVAVDAGGDLFITNPGNNNIRKVTPTGMVVTVAGTGTPGFSGDGGPAIAAQLKFPTGIAVNAGGDLFIADSNNNRIRRVTFTQQALFTMADRGGISSMSLGTAPSVRVGYASIQPAPGTAAPAGLAIFGYRQNNILISEASVPAAPPIRSGRIYAEVNGPVNTGLAIANPNNQPATVSFFFTNTSGDFGNGTATIAPNGQMAGFLNQNPFNGPSSLSGTFTFSSSVPVAVIALRGLTNERSEFLITTLPVADLSAPVSTATTVFPQFADGGGWTTQVVLVNPGDSVLTGNVQFVDKTGQPATITVDGQANTSFVYSLSPRSSRKLQSSGAGGATVAGSVRVVPDSNTAAPSGLTIFSFRNGGVTVTEAGVPALALGTAFRLYAEVAGPLQTGIAVANPSNNATTVTLELTRLDGSSAGLTGILPIPANGQTSLFLNEVQGFSSLQTPFQGVLRVLGSSPISVIGLRGRTNERGDFLIATTPPVNEASALSFSPIYFPHIADSGGYTTQFILFSPQPGSAPAGTIQFLSQTGTALNLEID